MTLAEILFFLGLNLALLAIYLALTRIARAFERLADSLDKLSNETALQSVQDFAWHAGRSFEQGRRTDR